MLEVHRNQSEYFLMASETSPASPEAIYDLLADLRTHLEWGGKRLGSATQRLVELNAPEGPATVGTEFTSVGHTSGRPWYDRSRVTWADRPVLFGFHTRGQLAPEDGTEVLEGEWIHRYEIAPNGPHSRLTYRLRARLTLPRTTLGNDHPRYVAVVYQIFVPIIVRRGIRSLLAMAEERTNLPLNIEHLVASGQESLFAAPPPLEKTHAEPQVVEVPNIDFAR